MAALVVSILTAFLFFRHIDWLEFAWLFAVCGLVAVGVPVLTVVAARAPAGDMATFLIELAHPEMLEPETAAELQSAQIEPILRASHLDFNYGPQQ